jgi:hypothetical protein
MRSREDLRHADQRPFRVGHVVLRRTGSAISRALNALRKAFEASASSLAASRRTPRAEAQQDELVVRDLGLPVQLCQDRGGISRAILALCHSRPRE